MGRWLKKVQEGANKKLTQPTQPSSVSSVGTLYGDSAKNDLELGRESPGPANDIDTIIEVLTQQVGRPLGEELIRLARQTMRSMSRQARAELAVVLDDAFETATSVETARRECHRLLADTAVIEAAKATWPVYSASAEGGTSHA